ncbi:hypothetical protein TNCV_2334721 [Trichonephila clavipes]|nr:hypothetical protein TNCV_2334721 [Trichonephila clavipes]
MPCRRSEFCHPFSLDIPDAGRSSPPDTGHTRTLDTILPSAHRTYPERWTQFCHPHTGHAPGAGQISESPALGHALEPNRFRAPDHDMPLVQDRILPVIRPQDMPLAQDRVLRPTTGHNPNAGQNSALCHPATIHTQKQDRILPPDTGLTSRSRQIYANRPLCMPWRRSDLCHFRPLTCPFRRTSSATSAADMP